MKYFEVCLIGFDKDEKHSELQERMQFVHVRNGKNSLFYSGGINGAEVLLAREKNLTRATLVTQFRGGHECVKL